jgi:Tfp pilus assembly protein PilO
MSTMCGINTVNVVNLGYLGIEKDFLEQLSALLTERKEIKNCHKYKGSVTKIILEKG